MDPNELFGHAIRRLVSEGPLDERWEFVCECPDVACHAMVRLTLVDFDERRAASPPALILADHDEQASQPGTATSS
jgi:hypothetical protein